jgi:hypothetical protein
MYADVIGVTADANLTVAMLDTETTVNIVVLEKEMSEPESVRAEYRAAGKPNSVMLIDTLLVITGSEGVEFVSLAQPELPYQTRFCPIAGGAVGEGARQGQILWIPAGSNGVYGYALTETSDQPAFVVDGAGSAYGAGLEGSYLIVLGFSGTTIVEITNPVKPHIVAEIASGYSQSAAMRDNRMYLWKGTGYSVYDISDIGGPVHLYTNSLFASRQQAVFDLPFVYVAAGGQGVLRFDLTDIQNPDMEVMYNTPGWAEYVFMRDRDFWVADGLSLIHLQDDIATDVTRPDDPIVPDDFSLSQNFPNPFNPSTVVAFALPRASAVTLSVFNVLGQEVCRREMALSAGRQEVTLDLSGQASGVYFYRVMTSDWRSSRKMLLLK